MSVISLHGSGSGNLTERVAEEVRALMGRHNVTQMQLVDVLGVSQTGVSKRLRGLTPFDANEIGVLADYFGVNPAQLLGEVVSPRPAPDGGSSQSRGGRGSNTLVRSYRIPQAA
jgi:transcriptional regulator with XRE-family HTH domain